MISLDKQGKRFKHRVAGLCTHDGYVLLTKADQDDYWILPGGRAELLENTRTTLRRELLEETGREAEVEDLLWIAENLFHLDGTNYHDPAFVYSVSPTDPSILDDTRTHHTTDGDIQIELRWFELDRIRAVNFQPPFLKTLLNTTARNRKRAPPKRS